MTYVWLFCILILKVYNYSCAADACTKSFSLCRLPVDLDIEQTIESILLQPPQEIEGDDNSADIPKRGAKGKKGQVGYMSLTGPPGLRGYPGDPGFDGPKGITSPRGDKGETGVVGPSGPPGIDGVCPCRLGPRNVYFEGPLKNKLCKNTPVGITGNFMLKITKKANVRVTCVIREKATVLTCLRNDKKEPKTYSFSNISEGFWLSSKNFTLDELYGINRNILTYFQSKSNAAFQTIRYHCYNFNPFPRDNVDKSLLMLTWNDKAIGPMPTLTMPFFYSVIHDGCSYTPKDTWSYTDIKLVSVHPRRVPVTDFFIRDIGNKIDQQFRIENIELCFD